MSITTPAVYVGTYHKYACGSIEGRWFDLTDYSCEDDFYEACRELHADESEPEFMFQDIEGIPDNMASESHINWDFIDAFQQAQSEKLEEAYVAWVEYSRCTDYDEFTDAYRGEAGSEEDYAFNYVDETGLLDSLPNNLKCYFDYEAFARDLFSSGYYFADGFVFSS